MILGQALKFVCETCPRWCLARGDVVLKRQWNGISGAYLAIDLGSDAPIAWEVLSAAPCIFSILWNWHYVSCVNNGTGYLFLLKNPCWPESYLTITWQSSLPFCCQETFSMSWANSPGMITSKRCHQNVVAIIKHSHEHGIRISFMFINIYIIIHNQHLHAPHLLHFVRKYGYVTVWECMGGMCQNASTLVNTK